MPGDARGYSWPPFQPGHTLNLVHGAEHEATIAARADDIHATLDTVAPWLAAPEYAPALLRYLRAAAREELLHSHIEQVSATGGVLEVPSRMWEQATAATRLAAQLSHDLGLTPLGHARLKAMTGTAAVTELSLADLLERGRAHRVAAEAAVRPAEPPAAIEATIDTDEPEETL